MTIDQDQEYLLGSADDELARLEFQHQVWAPETERLWELAGVGPGQTIVDLGCGPGLASIDLARRVGSDGRVIGVDSSARFLDLAATRARRLGIENVETLRSDSDNLDALTGVADVVLCRWLFCFLDRPADTVAAAATCLKAGGRLAVLDYFNYLGVALQPHSSVTRKVFRHIDASFTASGGSLDVGGELPTMMIAAGFDVDAIIPVCRTGRPGSDAWNWVSSFLNIYLPGLVETGRMDRGLYAEFLNEWRSREQDPGTFLFTPPMVGVVATKQ